VVTAIATSDLDTHVPHGTEGQAILDRVNEVIRRLNVGTVG
jgi:hypothetical protein